MLGILSTVPFLYFFAPSGQQRSLALSNLSRVVFITVLVPQSTDL